MTNFDEHFGSPAKLSCCIIENDLEAEMRTGDQNCIRVYTTLDDQIRELGTFRDPCEFEDWLCSDLSFNEWKQRRMIEEKRELGY